MEWREDQRYTDCYDLWDGDGKYAWVMNLPSTGSWVMAISGTEMHRHYPTKEEAMAMAVALVRMT